MQQSLFDFTNQTQHTGYRLHALELFNWGTFTDKIWRLDPNGDTALLTGANGSGKSTLVDALLTLLVPNQKRNYNQAAGDGRRERSEHSYVRGAYGRLQSAEEYTPTTQYIRDTNSYSVLLAHFHNAGYDEDVTLAQIFWLTDSLNKFYVVATIPLTIEQHFADFATIRELKKQLRAIKGVSIEDQFNRYSRKFRKHLGLNTSKALDLFNQTVTIKEIGQLNDFVRQHMLEKTDVQDKIKRLQEHYENLMLAYQAMQRAEHQLTLLRPLAAEARKYEAAQAEIDILRGCQTAIPIYFAGKKWQLLQKAITQAQQDYDTYHTKLDQLDEQIARLRQQETDLQVAINTDETGRRLQQLDQEIRYTLQSQQRKQTDANQYNFLADALQLKPYQDETSFAHNRQQATKLATQLDKQLDTSAEQLRQAQIAENQLAQEHDAIQQELDSLHGRTSQIPARNLRVRAQILDALTIAETDVPFIGELLQIKDSQNAWEGALERLLHNFGLRLLVPERHYDRFTRYVNDHHLNGRIVFHQIPEDATYQLHRDDNPRLLRHKIDIKPDTPYYDWIENELLNQFDYTCCDTLDQFDRAQKAITITGLSKSGGRGRARYEKDDRRSLTDRRHYILGWHNQDKINALTHESQQLNQQRQQAQTQINHIQAEQKKSQKQLNLTHQLLTFTDFTQLDWRHDAAHIQQLNQQKERLQQSANHLQQLQQELTNIKTKLSQTTAQHRQDADTLSKLDYQIKEYQRQIKKAQTNVNQADEAAMKQYAPRIKAQINKPLNLGNVDTFWHNIDNHFHEAIDSERRRSSIYMGRLLKLMQEYKDAYPAETIDFDTDVASIPEFDRELNRIEQDDLPQYTTRFRRMRDEKVIEAIALFQADLHKYIEEIQENIANLNQSLHAIDYTPDTYIQLQTENNRDAEIRDFRQSLRDCLIDVGQQRTETAYEASFAKVRDLITRFKEDTRWTNKVTDVRYWLNFAAIERYRADDTEKHYYSDSTGKSGGQKAKLAYTILASAIAFQFGLTQGETKSKALRFVVVDEAFSRSDENNSRYAMQLFQKLDLQLLVVTPMTGIHIVEPFIKACHFVWNNNEGNYSQVHTMSIRELQQQRAAAQTTT
ncbi:MAG TPA: ATP-binding protein [Anaerolineae bacterium]|nr:ATP-binding protein [Anaerolineae bacterium]